MQLRDLANRLKVYPALFAFLLEHMTDDEYEEYVVSLPDDEEALVGAVAMPQHEPLSSGESRDGYHSSTVINVPDIASSLLGVRHHLDRPTRQSTSLEGSSSDIDLLETWLNVAGVEECCHASPSFGVEWRRHILANIQVITGERSARDESQEELSSWVSTARRDVEGLIAQSLEVTEVEDLGPDLFSVILSGPEHTTLLFSSSALAEVEPLEREFMLYHMAAHVLIPGHMPHRTFAIRVEYKRGHTPEELYKGVGKNRRYLEGDYVREEGEADDGASCTLYSAYVTDKRLTSLSKKMARGALQRGATVRQLRELIRERERTQDRLFKFASHMTAALGAWDLDRLRRAPLNYLGPLRVVRPKDDRHVYVIGRAKGGKSWKRWVCSGKVLSRLGLQIGDVETLPEGALQEFTDERPLLDPSEVDQLREVLSESLIKRRRVFLTSGLETASQ